MKKINLLISLLFIICLYSCNSSTKTAETSVAGTATSKKQVAAMLDSLNVAAAKADFDNYFNFYTEDAVFAGTDATERWNKKDFMVWAKPFFDKKTTWDFTALQRHIYFNETGELAWFDELLKTQMKVCRGSGVVVKQGSGWKLNQYILSTTIPNSRLDTIIKIKEAEEDKIIDSLQKK